MLGLSGLMVRKERSRNEKGSSCSSPGQVLFGEAAAGDNVDEQVFPFV